MKKENAFFSFEADRTQHIQWSKILVLDPNCGVDQDEGKAVQKQQHAIFIRVGKQLNSSHGFVDVIASPYAFAPVQTLFNFFINLHSLELKNAFPLLPFLTLQHQQFVYLITRQTVTFFVLSRTCFFFFDERLRMWENVFLVFSVWKYSKSLIIR